MFVPDSDRASVNGNSIRFEGKAILRDDGHLWLPLSFVHDCFCGGIFHRVQPGAVEHRQGGTRYSVRLLPLGGYNNLAGETRKNLRTDEQERAEPAKKRDAAAASVHTYDPHAPLFPLTVDGKSFVEASPWQRFLYFAAGA